MTAPAPLFAISLANPLRTARHTPAEVLTLGRVVDPTKADPSDARLADESSGYAFQIITWGSRGHLLVEWPDGVLASAYVPFGLLVGEAVDKALLAAYDQGREVLERINLAHAEHAGRA
jgi:hypothetical protein